MHNTTHSVANGTHYVFWLGSQPLLSLTELVRRLEREGRSFSVEVIRERYVLLTLASELPIGWLGGMGGIERIGRLEAEQSHSWTAEELIKVLGPLPPKFRLGLSSLYMPKGYAQRVSYELKTLARSQDSRVRFVLPKGGRGQLNAAQVLFNRLYELPHRELTMIRDGKQYLLVTTVAIQDIESYERRDTRRPARDGRVGLLPPKLAQMMLNMVPGFVQGRPAILDPFCGMGTLLQEGWLMGYQMSGSDASERMVAASEQNLRWLAECFAVDAQIQPRLAVHDVQKSFPVDAAGTFDAVVTEPYLGAPLTTPLPEEEATLRFRDLANLYRRAFEHLHPLLMPGGWVVLALPAIKVHSRQNPVFMLFPASFIDEIEKYGYSYQRLVPDALAAQYPRYATDRGSALYARPQALVGREITLWRKR